MKVRSGLLLVGLLIAVGCDREPAPSRAEVAAPTSGRPAWLKGTDDERFAAVERHLRGFDMAMVETAYRYGELHAAGQDRNWGYVLYQAGKIRTAIGNGSERRPARAVVDLERGHRQETRRHHRGQEPAQHVRLTRPPTQPLQPTQAADLLAAEDPAGRAGQPCRASGTNARRSARNEAFTSLRPRPRIEGREGAGTSSRRFEWKRQCEG